MGVKAESLAVGRSTDFGVGGEVRIPGIFGRRPGGQGGDSRCAIREDRGKISSPLSVDQRQPCVILCTMTYEANEE